jgi:DNA-binding response OmpR family regulator
MRHTVLIVTDRPTAQHSDQHWLAEQGLRVLLAGDRQEALAIAQYENPALILLDTKGPQFDDYGWLYRLRRGGRRPISILAECASESDAQLWLDYGADDFMLRPFEMGELRARIRVALARTAAFGGRGSDVLRVGEIVLDEQLHLVTVGGKPAALTDTEFALLATMMRYPGRAFSRVELGEQLAQVGFVGIASTLNVHIRNLRLKIEADPHFPRYVQTVFGIGYRIDKAS